MSLSPPIARRSTGALPLLHYTSCVASMLSPSVTCYSRDVRGIVVSPRRRASFCKPLKHFFGCAKRETRLLVDKINTAIGVSLSNNDHMSSLHDITSVSSTWRRVKNHPCTSWTSRKRLHGFSPMRWGQTFFRNYLLLLPSHEEQQTNHDFQSRF